MSRLKEKGVKKLAVLLQGVVTGSSSAVDYREDKAVSRPWHNKERLQATHLFCKYVPDQPNYKAFYSKLSDKDISFLFPMGRVFHAYLLIKESSTELKKSFEQAPFYYWYLYTVKTHNVKPS